MGVGAIFKTFQFEVFAYLSKVKEDEKFNHRNTFKYFED